MYEASNKDVHYLENEKISYSKVLLCNLDNYYILDLLKNTKNYA